MEYEDTLTVTTPEGLEVELALAGVGSRFASALIDFLLELVAFAAVAFLLFRFASEAVAVAVGSLAFFAVVFGYHVLFETLASGRSPGKRALGLRVVRLGGAPVRFKDSAIRNIARLVDLLPPVTYGLGAAVILLTRRNQRLGDLAAGTIVVRVRRGDRRGRARTEADEALPEGVERWDVSGVSSEDLVAVRRFLDRRAAIEAAARSRLAAELAGRLRPKVAGSADNGADERFLEGVAAAKAARG